MTNLVPSEQGRVDRLPQWAQDTIRRLDSRVDEARSERDEALTLLEENTGIDLEVGGQRQGVKVPRRKYVFVGERWTSDLRVRFDNANRLEVTANGPIQVDVDASNIVYISERRP
jgi:hypothetical protein